MTIPRSKALHCLKGFQAQADVGVNSPIQTNSQNVNVIVSPLTKDKEFTIVSDKNNCEEKEIEIKNRDIDLKLDDGLNDELETTTLLSASENNFKERSVETARKSVEEMEALIKDKDNLIEALSLILDIYENNPLIVNKFIVPKEEDLTRLLFLLTNAEQIELIKNDPEIKCCKTVNDKVQYVSKIMIKKNGNTYNFKYSFPNVIQLLENRNISYKIVA